MPSGFHDALMGPALGLYASPAPALLSGTYYFAVADRPAIGSMTVTTKLDDVAVGDTSTAESGGATSTYSGACAHLTLTLYVTSLVDLGALYNLTSWSAKAKVEDAAAEVPACTVPPDEEYAPDNGWWLESSEDASSWTAETSGTFTGSSYNSLGGSLGRVGRYVRLIQRIHHDSQRATGPTIYANCADFRLYGVLSGGGSTTAPTGAPTIHVLGVCEGAQATLWWDSVSRATYYEVRRITAAEPSPGTLIYSGAQKTAEDPLVDSPVPIGRSTTYTVRACNSYGCGPTSQVEIVPCYPDGTAGACDCDAVEATHTITNATEGAHAVVAATEGAHTIVEPGRREC
jgi:hypothetical protein